MLKHRFPIPAGTSVLTRDGRDSGANNVTVKLDYDRGGMSLFTYKQVERGYYLNVSATKIEQGDGYETETFTLFATPGYKALGAPVKRANPKLAERLSGRVAAVAEELATAFLAGDHEATAACIARIRSAA